MYNMKRKVFIDDGMNPELVKWAEFIRNVKFASRSIEVR